MSLHNMNQGKANDDDFKQLKLQLLLLLLQQQQQQQTMFLHDVNHGKADNDDLEDHLTGQLVWLIVDRRLNTDR